MIRYYAQVQGSLWNKLSLALNANRRDYRMMNEANDQIYIDVNGRIGYMFTPQTNLSFEVGYRKQVGQGIDLDLLTARGEFTTSYRRIMVKIGVEMYKRDYLQENTSLMGGYVRIIRYFNWAKR
jgi:outer membrane receptor for ferrienterochelin and colicin